MVDSDRVTGGGVCTVDSDRVTGGGVCTVDGDRVTGGGVCTVNSDEDVKICVCRRERLRKRVWVVIVMS